MLDPVLLVDRVRASSSSHWHIGVAVDLPGIPSDSFSYPSVLYMPRRDVAERNDLIGATAQRVTETFVWRVGVRDFSDRLTVAGYADLRGIVNAIRSAMVGWVPEQGYSEIELVGGQPYRLDDNTLWWDDQYLTQYHIRGPVA